MDDCVRDVLLALDVPECVCVVAKRIMVGLLIWHSLFALCDQFCDGVAAMICGWEDKKKRIIHSTFQLMMMMMMRVKKPWDGWIYMEAGSGVLMVSGEW